MKKEIVSAMDRWRVGNKSIRNSSTWAVSRDAQDFRHGCVAIKGSG